MTDISIGIVGSDPYLAPEVYDARKYDPQPADIWSLAIVFACMTLRRFPWKAPRLTDNSFKLFCSAPSPGTPMADAAASAKSGNELTPAVEESRRSSAPPTDPNPSSEQSSEHHHRHHHRQRSGKSEDAMSVAENQARNSSKSEVVKGPWRLLRLLPRETRTIIGRMLETDPKRRATLEDMFADSWIRTTPICRQVEAGQVVRAEGHEHTLEPGTAVQPAEG